MKAITPESEHADSILITKLTFVAAASSGMLFSIFPLLSIALFMGSLAYTYYFL
jgi:hypothetical protein